MKIRKAIFPAAGLGTRFLPATKSQPKEMLPIIDKPVIQYLVEEAVASGIEEIIMVTGRGKRAIEDHFDRSIELEQVLIERGNAELLEEVRRIADLVNIIYVRQPVPKGDGDAILCARSIIGDEPCAVLFGDDIVDSSVPALKQLMEVYEEKHAPVLGLERVSQDRVSHYGIVTSRIVDGRLVSIQDLVEKPTLEEAPSNLAIIGKYIVTPELLDSLERAKKFIDGGELKLIDGLKEYVRMSPLYGYEIEGKRYDTGDKLGFLQATIDFALKHPQLGGQVKKYLSTLDFQEEMSYNDSISKIKTNNKISNGRSAGLSRPGSSEGIRFPSTDSGREETRWQA